MELIRLNKYLKDMGICSRRQADEFISLGYVTVNGQVITEMGLKVNPDLDKVVLLPILNQKISQFSYILLNKPTGYVCSKSTVDGKNIFELLPPLNNLTYAGRLDKDSHGLIILSNDGKFVYRVSGSEFAKEKEYVVRVHKPITPNFLRQQSNGSIQLDGRLVKCSTTKFINNYTYSIILIE
ncbi:MAG: rRNA pseudouridine synthase, partial [Burkholderiales bacterium]|nr:rRNA pseudouridine synthase [Burkholderiales bacterium]